MRAIFALVLAVLCAQQTLGFKIQSFKVEAGEDIDKDIMELLTQHIKNMDPRVMDRQDIDKANEDIDKDSEDIDNDSEDIDKDSEDIDKDSEDIDTDSEDIDKDSEDIDKDNDEKGKKRRLFLVYLRGYLLSCN